MSFIFTMRSTPRSARSRANSSLPAISEDGSPSIEQFPRSAPPIPVRASNRPPHKAFGFKPPRHSYNSPPAYRDFSFDDERPNDEKLAEARRGLGHNKHIAKRGGWKRLLILAVAVALCIVGLVVGLVIGLRNRRNGSSSPASNSNGGASGNIQNGPANPASSTAFPAGSYSFPTFLSSVTTNCTSNSATWRCYPYATYSQSPSTSEATFQWIINPVPSTNTAAAWNYTISSTNNIFSILFTNASLSLQNLGQEDEHYYFQTSMIKPTKPVSQLGSQNVASTCYFNETVFQGYLYTKMQKSYPSNSTNATSGQLFGDWPYAVKVQQVQNAGVGTPTCLDPEGQSLGDFSVSDTAEQCECLYLNTGT